LSLSPPIVHQSLGWAGDVATSEGADLGLLEQGHRDLYVVFGAEEVAIRKHVRKTFSGPVGLENVFPWHYNCLFLRSPNSWVTMIRRSWMASASIETKLELWTSSLRDVQMRIRPLFARERVAS
jgi:hypothetical protein